MIWRPKMGWTVTASGSNSEQGANEFFGALGRAVYVASEFERKCEYLLQLGTIVRRVEEETLDFQTLLEPALPGQSMLGPVLQALKRLGKLKREDLECLDAGRRARNYIAHEAGELGPLHTVTRSRLVKRTSQLQDQVKALSTADALISEWMYCIEQKDHRPPQWLTEHYADGLKHWIMTGNREALEAARKDDEHRLVLEVQRLKDEREKS